MDLETLFTIVYVMIDDWYRAFIEPYKTKVGATPRMSDSEVLTIAVVGSFQRGTAWDSERSLVRKVNRHWQHLFPTMLQVSAFNQRRRRLCGVLQQLAHHLGDQLDAIESAYECVDGLPLPAASLAQITREKSQWLWTGMVSGRRNKRFWGHTLFASIRPSGVITGWVVGSANLHERWLMEALLSTRAGIPQVVGPPHNSRKARAQRATPPVGYIGGFFAAGRDHRVPYLGDKAFNGKRWREHWQTQYGATVISPPTKTYKETWTKPDRLWFARRRQNIETIFSILTEVFGLKRLRAHSHWGMFTRIASAMSAYHFGLLINQQLGRNPLSHGTLIE